MCKCEMEMERLLLEWGKSGYPRLRGLPQIKTTVDDDDDDDRYSKVH